MPVTRRSGQGKSGLRDPNHQLGAWFDDGLSVGNRVRFLNGNAYHPPFRSDVIPPQQVPPQQFRCAIVGKQELHLSICAQSCPLAFIDS